MTDDSDDKTQDEAPYVPPDSSMTLQELIKRPLKEITPVDCSTCPVSMLCQEGQGGAGYVCDICGATGVYVDEPEPGAFPKNLLVMDCGKHRFETLEGKGKMPDCGLCTGDQMELLLRNEHAVNHYVPTVHARVPLAERQKVLAEKLKYWKGEIAKEKKKGK